MFIIFSVGTIPSSKSILRVLKFIETINFNTINLASMPKGMYFIYLENEGKSIVKKFVVN